MARYDRRSRRAIGGGRSNQGPTWSTDPLFAFDPLGPEKAARQAKEAFESQEFARALAHSLAAVGRLHDCYVLQGFAHREPSGDDVAIVDGVVAALAALRSRSPLADLGAAVRQATYLLGSIVDAATTAGLDGSRFVAAMAEVAALAPDVDTSDVFWS